MNTLKSGLRVAISALALLPSFSFAQTPAAAPASDWKAIVQNRLSLYGHRNWIVVADSAFPAYAEPGIETIAVDEDLPSVLKYVAHAISSSRRVRATVFVDRELQFIDEHDYPGVTEVRRQIAAEFAKEQVSSMPHADIMNKVDEAGKTYRILFLKTTNGPVHNGVHAPGLRLPERRRRAEDQDRDGSRGQPAAEIATVSTHGTSVHRA